MNRLRKVIGNTVISLIGQGVTWTSTIILTIAYGRFLGDVKLGELFFALTFVALIGFPIDAGFNQQLTRDVAQEPSKALRYVSNILCFKIILWFGLYTCILLLCWVLGYPAEIRTLVTICGITLLSTSIGNIMSASHYAFERVVFPVFGNILEKGLSALVGVILLQQGANVQIMAYVLLGSSVTNMLWQTFWVLRLVGIPRTIDIPLARFLLRKSIPFILYGVLGVIYYRIDTILLSLMTSIAVVGWYGAGYRLFDTLVFLPSLVISAIMYHVFSKLTIHSQIELKLAIEKSLNFLLFCGIPISTGLIVAAPNLMGFLYHRADFTNAIPVIQYLAPGLLLLYVNSVLTSVMISTGREKKITLMAGIALVFNLGLNLFLIPPYQHIGAATATSLTEGLLMVLSLAFIPRYLWPLRSLKVALKALLAALTMGLAIWFVRQQSLFVVLVVAAFVYFVATTLLGTIPREDVRALYTSIRHKAKHGKTGIKQTKTISDDIFEVTEEEMQQEQEQELILALAHEMTNPVLPAYKHEMTNPLLPAYKREATNPLLAAYKDEMHPPRTPLPSGSEDVDGDITLLRRVVRPIIKAKKTRDLSRIKDEDDDTLVIRRVFRPTKAKKTSNLSR